MFHEPWQTHQFPRVGSVSKANKGAFSRMFELMLMWVLKDYLCCRHNLNRSSRSTHHWALFWYKAWKMCHNLDHSKQCPFSGGCPSKDGAMGQKVHPSTIQWACIGSKNWCMQLCTLTCQRCSSNWVWHGEFGSLEVQNKDRGGTGDRIKRKVWPRWQP